MTATVGPEPVTDTQCVEIFPETTAITLATDPIGLQVTYEDEGIELSGPALIHPVVNSVQTISVLPIEQHRTFTEWADGESSRSRSFTVGTQPETFTAIFENRRPTARIAPDGASGLAPLEVAFAGGGSSDPEGDVLEYAWDAGAAGASSEVAPSFSFPFGEHLVTLTVTDQLGATDSDEVVVSVLPSCGNGAREADEECDDGNLVNGDGCDANCTTTACGNGVVTAGEQCDDGNLVGGDGCDANCTVTGCGNGVASGAEECDDGNLVSGDGCDANCTRPRRCGNGRPDRRRAVRRRQPRQRRRLRRRLHPDRLRQRHRHRRRGLRRRQRGHRRRLRRHLPGEPRPRRPPRRSSASRR